MVVGYSINLYCLLKTGIKVYKGIEICKSRKGGYVFVRSVLEPVRQTNKIMTPRMTWDSDVSMGSSRQR